MKGQVGPAFGRLGRFAVRRAFGAWGVWLFASLTLVAQSGVQPAALRQPLGETWPMYNGDYSGRRFSTLATIDTSNVSSLAQAWVFRPDAGSALAGGGGAPAELSSG